MKEIYCRVWAKNGRQDLTYNKWNYFVHHKQKLHRLDGPAIEYSHGTKEWWVDGKRHRRVDPAIERKDGTKKWFVDGTLHRLDGPAIEWADGTKEWWINGERHRLDGPAVEWTNGRKWWFINGKELPTKEVEIWLKENNINLSEPENRIAFKLRWS